MVIKLVVNAREKDGKLTGQKFIAFTTKKKDGTKVQLKFRKEIEGLPKKAGIYEMEIESTSMNLKLTDYGEVWWVSSNPISVKEYIPEDLAKDQF